MKSGEDLRNDQRVCYRISLLFLHSFFLGTNMYYTKINNCVGPAGFETMNGVFEIKASCRKKKFTHSYVFCDTYYNASRDD